MTAVPTASTSILGNPVLRVEDPALLTGAGCYVADLPVEGLLHVAFVRSTVAHAQVVEVDVSGIPEGAVAFVAADLGLPPVSGMAGVAPMVFAQPPLATDRVRYVGQPVVAVVAASVAAAADAVEAVVVEYQPLPVVVDPEAALAPDAPVLFPDAGTNVAAQVAAELSPDLFADADVVVEERILNQRIAVAPMEGQAITAEPGPDGRVTVHISTQSAHGSRDALAGPLGLEPSAIRAVAPNVGGGFGAKSGAAIEHVVTVALARRLGRPVRWVQTRSENLATMHARAQVQHVRIGATRDGRITALRADVVVDAGAYPGVNCFLPLLTKLMATGVYRIPRVEVATTSVATNTAPLLAYRGAGRPEASAMVERMVDRLAVELALDPVELRRRNLLTSDQMPYTTPTGAVYDSADHALVLERVVDLAGYDELRAEQARRRAAGDHRLLGIGLASYVEVTGGYGQARQEFAAVDLALDPTSPIGVRVTVKSGASAHGQGHATTFAQIAADALGLPMGAVAVVQGDTDVVARGTGTFASRSVQLGGSAVRAAGVEVVERARRLAAEVLEAAVDDVVAEAAVDGTRAFSVKGVPARSLSWRDLVAHDAGALATALDWAQDGATYPFGAHVAVVEVDADTGAVRLLRHVAVDDCGTVINPLLADGQVHGGIAQGASQALFEAMVYDADGNPLTATFAEYAFPSAAEMPSFELGRTVTPTPLNPLGAKGIGESGTIGATPAVHNAIIDALAHLGVRHVDMPCPPERIWRAIRDATEAL